MAWLKRNLALVITSVVALGLLGFAGFFLWTKMEEASDASAKLLEQTEQLTKLAERKPHPGTDKLNNIKSAQEEVVRVTNFLAEIKKKHFDIIDVSNKVDAAVFKSLLDNTIGELERNAKQVSVALPPKFDFGFSEQRKKVELNAKALPMLFAQLKDIRNIANVLYNARINQIVSFRRSQTADDPATGGDDYLMNYKLGTNNAANTLSSTYEASFVGFSADLASVLEGLLRAPGCYIVKAVTVEQFQTSDEHGTDGESASPIPSVISRYGMDPRMAARYGLMPGGRGGAMSRYGGRRPGGEGAPPPVALVPAPPKQGPGTHIDENKLKFKLLIESVKLKQAK